jgi:hypothetical protein
MKELLCKAFCAALDVRSVPAGLAVRTPYENSDGDPLLLYFVRDTRGRWRIEDDGTQVPLLEAFGVDIGGKARGEAFNALLDEYDVQFDTDARTISSAPLTEEELGAAAVKFVALLLRLQDLALLAPQVVRSTFREDAIAAIHSAFGSVARVEEDAPLSPDLVGQEADCVIRARGKPPLGIFLGTSEENALHALVAKMEAEKYRGIDGQVVLMVERAKANPVRETTYGLALARLDAVVSFRESKEDTMQRLTRMLGINAAPAGLQ